MKTVLLLLAFVLGGIHAEAQPAGKVRKDFSAGANLSRQVIKIADPLFRLNCFGTKTVGLAELVPRYC